MIGSPSRGMRARRSSGFSLVEALVALVVLSIGMLGIAALYVESLRSGRTALLRTQAVALAGDMADRIRANPAGGLAYGDVVTVNDTVAACAPGGAGCTSTQLAHHDKALWLQSIQGVPPNIAAALPGATGTVAVDDTTTPFTYTITISWVESGQAAADPNTYQMRIEI
jgi:type IV pilus assembly protein PilV